MRRLFLVRLRRAYTRAADRYATPVTVRDAVNICAFGTLEAARAFIAASAPLHSPFATRTIIEPTKPGRFNVYDATADTDWESYTEEDITTDETPVRHEYGNIQTVTASDLQDALRAGGLPAVPHAGTFTVSDWNRWWNATAPAMTIAQRAAIWRVFTPSPYLIVAVEVEGV